MSLRPSELAAVAAELNAHLAGAVVQKVNATQPGRLWLELRTPGRSVTLHCCAAPQVGRLSIADSRPQGTPGEASGFQHLLRQRLTGARLTAVTSQGLRASLHFTRDEAELELQLELSAPAALLLTAENRILAVSAEDPVADRPGALFVPRTSAAGPGSSRLAVAPSSQLALSRAAEALFAEEEGARALDAALRPIVSRLARLARTRKKVEAEAARTALAARHRADGELLKQHLSQIPRGAREVTLTEYLPDGTIAERTVALAPSRTPQKHAEWLFHQYRRLTRGAQLSQQRLQKLDEEKAALEEQLRARAVAPPGPVGKRRRAQAPIARAFREYLGANGEKIWVGKGSQDNDTLTFKLSRPHYLWLHARGVPGAHVVIPLERGAAVPQELLLDAAHLALHHSNSKGEPRGEVSYVPVKYLRKVKGSPGAVTFSQEKTFVLRLEPKRLVRLLASEQ